MLVRGIQLVDDQHGPTDEEAHSSTADATVAAAAIAFPLVRSVKTHTTRPALNHQKHSWC
jgi:hypothetical protein